ncbi:MAG: succinate-semialdehyde dehydrogenase / glutarate-semialdehyde dehydrogenase, partial [Clostridiales bacterium]|nr:succinate-semialdehyde dehydrogenase / glutarate-semialdehyde dehydrogenase [Clostridiales bacterium]
MMHEKMFIAGKWVESETGDTFKVINPATEEAFADAPLAAPNDVERAIAAADGAFTDWSALTPFERGRYLRIASSLILERSKEIAKLMTMEQGKPLAEAEGEVKKGADILRYY